MEITAQETGRCINRITEILTIKSKNGFGLKITIITRMKFQSYIVEIFMNFLRSKNWEPSMLKFQTKIFRTDYYMNLTILKIQKFSW